jgi:hypothetical protein
MFLAPYIFTGKKLFQCPAIYFGMLTKKKILLPGYLVLQLFVARPANPNSLAIFVFVASPNGPLPFVMLGKIKTVGFAYRAEAYHDYTSCKRSGFIISQF